MNQQKQQEYDTLAGMAADLTGGADLQRNQPSGSGGKADKGGRYWINYLKAHPELKPEDVESP